VPYLRSKNPCCAVKTHVAEELLMLNENNLIWIDLEMTVLNPDTYSPSISLTASC
jgi:hypothetical protein